MSNINWIKVSDEPVPKQENIDIILWDGSCPYLVRYYADSDYYQNSKQVFVKESSIEKWAIVNGDSIDIDYRSLLSKYIKHIGEWTLEYCESGRENYIDYSTDVKFTAPEIEQLKSLAEEGLKV